MVARKFIHIENTDDDTSNMPNIISKINFYKLTKLVTVDTQATHLPQFYQDIDKNMDFCGLPEITPAEISEISNALFEAQKEFISASNEFTKKVIEIENRSIEKLKAIADKKKKHENCKHENYIYQPISIKFQNQDGEANVAVRLSYPHEIEKQYPTNPQMPKPIWEAEVQTEAEAQAQAEAEARI